MAKKLPPKDDTGKLDADELKRLLDAALAEASKAKEHAGEVSNIVRNALEVHNLDRSAFGFIRRVHKMAEDRQQATLRDFLRMAITLGWLDQTDAFDDVAEMLAGVLGGKKKPSLRAVQ